MAADSVPVLEVNPADPSDIEVSFVPIEDLDDLLEDVEGDYELSFGELGAVSKLRKQAKLHGSVKVKHKGGFFKKLGRGLKRGFKAAATGGMSELARLRKVGRGAKRAAARTLRRGLRGGLKGRIRAAGRVKKILRVQAGKSSRVPLNRKAIVRKKASIKVAHKIAALGGSSVMKPRAKHAVAAAMKGVPLRAKGMKKPAKRAVRAIRGSNVRCCIIASRRGGGGMSGTLHERYRLRRHVNTCGPMLPRKFDATIRVLLGKLEDKNTSPSIQTKIERLKRLSGIMNAKTA